MKGVRGWRWGLAAVVLVVPAASAQAATVVSESTWGGVGAEVTNGAAVAPDGSAYLAGFTRSFDPFGQEQLFLVRFAADGSLDWQRTWEGPGQFVNDRANGVVVAPDGSVYVTGQTFGVRGDVLLLKFAPDGSLVWQQRWDGGGTEGGEAVAVAGDGSIYVTGATNSFGSSGGLFVLRFSPEGSLVWQRTRPGASGEGIAVGPDGNIAVAGLAPRPGGLVETDVVVLKVDPQGTLIWQRAYSTAEIADARGGVAVAGDGSVVVAGGIQDVTNNDVVNDTLIVRFGSDGSLAWDRGFGGRDGDFPGGVVALSDGTVLVGGETASFGAGSDDAFLLRLDANGRGIACNSWGGTGLDHGDDVEVAPGGTVLLGGTTDSPPPFTFGDCPRRTKALRGTVATPTVPLVDVTGVLADPNGTMATPAGTSPGGGGFDAVLVRIAP